MSAHLDHNAPLRHLVKSTLHKGRSVGENAKRLRYKRRKPPAPTPDDDPLDPVRPPTAAEDGV